MTAPRAQKIEALRAKLAALQAAEHAAAARARAAASKTARVQDTRRKVLAGTFLLDLLGATGVAQLSVQGRRFDTWLTRVDDRALFSLPPLASPSPATPVPHGFGLSAPEAKSRAEGGVA